MKRFTSLFLSFLLIIASTTMYVEKADAAATANITVTVNSATSLADTSDVADPTSAVSITVTPAVGASDASTNYDLRVRANKSTWTLTAYKSTAFSAGTTALAETDVKLMVSIPGAGAQGNSGSGTVAAGFSGTSGTLSDLSSNMASPTTLVTGSAKTSSGRDSSANANNYVTVRSAYSVAQDFFFEPGSATCTVTYILSQT